MVNVTLASFQGYKLATYHCIRCLFTFGFGASFSQVRQGDSHSKDFFIFPSPVKVMRIVFFYLLVLLLRRPSNLFRLTLKDTTLTNGNTSHFKRTTTRRNIRPLTRNHGTVNPTNSHKRVNILTPHLTTLSPTLFLRAMRGIRRHNQDPTNNNRLFTSIPPNNQNKTFPSHRRRLLLNNER